MALLRLMGSQFPNQGSNPGPWQWKRRALTIGCQGIPSRFFNFLWKTASRIIFLGANKVISPSLKSLLGKKWKCVYSFSTFKKFERGNPQNRKVQRKLELLIFPSPKSNLILLYLLPALFFLSIYFFKSHKCYAHTLFLKNQLGLQTKINPHWLLLFCSPLSWRQPASGNPNLASESLHASC